MENIYISIEYILYNRKKQTKKTLILKNYKKNNKKNI